MNKRTDATIVTTLTVTHVLEGMHGIKEGELVDIACDLAKAAKDAAWAGYVEHCLPGGHPDDISVSGSQIFLHDDQNSRRENNAQRSLKAEGGEHG